MNAKAALITLGALLAGGAAAATVAPFLASKVVDTNDAKNWYAPGGLALGLGSLVMVLGRKSPPIALAGGAMAGAGVGFMTLGYANKTLMEKQATQAAAGLFNGPIPVAPAAMPAFQYNGGRGSQLSSRGGFPVWNGIPRMSQVMATKGGMPTRSGSMPYG